MLIRRKVLALRLCVPVLVTMLIASACTKAARPSADTPEPTNAVSAIAYAPPASTNAIAAQNASTHAIPDARPSEFVLSQTEDSSLAPAPLNEFNHGGVYIATRKRPKPFSRVAVLLVPSGGPFVIAHDCVLVGLPDGKTILPIFEVDQIRWDVAFETLSIDGKPHRVGDHILLGGGDIPVEKAIVYYPYYRKLIEHCKPDRVWTVGLAA